MKNWTKTDVMFYVSLVLLFAGVWMQINLPVALIVIGSTGVIVSVSTAFFMTRLAAKINRDKK